MKNIRFICYKDIAGGYRRINDLSGELPPGELRDEDEGQFGYWSYNPALKEYEKLKTVDEKEIEFIAELNPKYLAECMIYYQISDK